VGDLSADLAGASQKDFRQVLVMTLLPWPALPPLTRTWPKHTHFELVIYERARAEAALQRLRVAVALLADIGAEELTPYPNESGGAWADAAKKVLEEIGEVPQS
jgi:hypothetical protein